MPDPLPACPADPRARVPGPDHPISLAPNPHRLVVRHGDTVLAETSRALTLREAGYPPVQYIPRDDVRLDRLARGREASYCPYKGDCAYFGLPGDAGPGSRPVAWSYEAPYAAVAAIAGHLAFYPDRVRLSEQPG